MRGAWGVLAAMLLWAMPLQADDKSGGYLGLTLQQRDGGSVTLADYRGKVVLVNYWATWCPPCREEMPVFAKVRQEYGAKGFEVVGVVYMDRPEPADLEAMLKELGVNYPILQGAPETVIAMSEAMGGVRGLPTSYLLDREGRVVEKVQGAIREGKLVRMLAPLLDGVTPPGEGVHER